MSFKIQDGALLGAQTAWGTPVTPTLSISVTGGSYQFEDTPIKSAQVNPNTSENESRKGFYHISGTLETEFSASQHDILLKHFFGDYTFTADTPVVGANTHLHKLTSTSADKVDIFEEGLTLEVGSDGKWFTFNSVVITSFTLTVEAPGIITMNYDWMAKDYTEAASGETFAPIATSKMFDNFQIGFQIGVLASEVTVPVSTFSITGNRGTAAKYGDISQNTPTKFVPGDVTPIQGDFTVEVSQATRAAIKSAFDNSTEQSVILTLTSDVLVTGSTYYTTTIAVKECKLVTLEPGIETSDRVEKYTFILGKDDQSDQITITNINGDATL